MFQPVLVGFAMLALPATAAAAQDINHQVRLGQAHRDGCHVQQVHTPAGKLVHAQPIVRCPVSRSDAAPSLEAEGSSPALPAAPRTGGNG